MISKLPCGWALFSIALALAARAEDSRRLFDFTPVSLENPIVAVIDDIAIPLSELRAYRDAERRQAVTDAASLPQRRAVLDDLINEYLHVDAAYRAGVPDSPGFARQMAATRTMVLTDFMAARAGAEFPALPAAEDAGHALAEKLFEAASIEVSNEACATLRHAAQAIAEVPPGEGAGDRLRTIVASTPEGVLARYEEKSISIRQVLIIYAGLPPEKRPAVGTSEGIVALIKPLILPELMALEAARRGIAAELAFQQKLIQNQNALLRFHAQGQIERRTMEMMAAPDAEEQLQAWYDSHRTDYAVIDGGTRRAASYAEARPRVEGDYSVALRDRLLAEEAQALRKSRVVKIDEKVLALL